MTYTPNKSIVRTIRESESDFRIRDGMVIYPRAMLHVTPDCPHHIAEMISLASSKGWLKCVAHVKDYELMMDRLSE
jgi:hypothetical protein